MTSKEDVCPLVLELKLRLWSLPCTGNVKQEKMRNEEDAPQTCTVGDCTSRSHCCGVFVGSVGWDLEIIHSCYGYHAFRSRNRHRFKSTQRCSDLSHQAVNLLLRFFENSF